MRVLVVLGTRPEAIKLAPVIQELQQRSGIVSAVCLTGQHRQMVEQVISLFNIKIDYSLNVMGHDQSLFDVTAKSLKGLESVLSSFRPDWLIVQGDTTTAFVSALSAFYRKVKIAHIEAGLRTYNKYFPFPEEVNRVLISRLTDLHFAPTDRARSNLLQEMVPPEHIHVVGNPVIDSLFMMLALIQSKGLDAIYQKKFEFIDFTKPVVLLTAHRRESFGESFRNICQAVREIARTHYVEFVFPVHLNPNIRGPVNTILGNIQNVHLLDPVAYSELIWLAQRSYFLLTDSGGLQEEGPSLGKPVVVMRNVTERQESMEAGLSVLVGTSRQTIIDTVSQLLTDHGCYKSMARQVNIYGDGLARHRIVGILSQRGVS